MTGVSCCMVTVQKPSTLYIFKDVKSASTKDIHNPSYHVATSAISNEIPFGARQAAWKFCIGRIRQGAMQCNAMQGCLELVVLASALSAHVPLASFHSQPRCASIARVIRLAGDLNGAHPTFQTTMARGSGRDASQPERVS